MSKKIKSLVVLFLFVFISACGDSDGESPSTGLEGTWALSSLEGVINSTVNVGGQEATTTNNVSASEIDYNMVLNNGDFTVSGSYNITNRIVVFGTERTISTPVSNVSGSGTYTNTDTELTLIGSFVDLQIDGMTQSGSSAGQTASYQINSSGQLVLTINETTTMDVLGTTATVVSDLTSIWTRQ